MEVSAKVYRPHSPQHHTPEDGACQSIRWSTVACKRPEFVRPRLRRQDSRELAAPGCYTQGDVSQPVRPARVAPDLS